MEYKLKGTFKNLNNPDIHGAYYSEESIEKGIKNFQEKLKKEKILGELNHPSDYTISLNNVSHEILDLKVNKNLDYELYINTLGTPNGKIMDSVLNIDENSIKPSFRGIGGKDNEGNDIFEIITFDII